jgi:mannose-6-phosphate isomerase-like protein (cupin superfamily)
MQSRWSNRPAGYTVDLEAATVANRDFRRVLYTTPRSQLVLMSLAPGEDVGFETHPFNDQFVRAPLAAWSASFAAAPRL